MALGKKYEKSNREISWAFFFTAGYFWWVSWAYEGAYFDPKTYGSMATSLPDSAWALWAVAGSSLLLYGLVDPPNRTLIVFGSAMQCLHFLSIGASALYDGNPTIGLYSLIFAYYFRCILRGAR